MVTTKPETKRTAEKVREQIETVKVSSEMVNAGVDVFDRMSTSSDSSYLVAEIYKAMHSVYLLDRDRA